MSEKKNKKSIIQNFQSQLQLNKKMFFLRIFIIILCLGVVVFFSLTYIPEIVESRRLAEQRLEKEREEELRLKLKAELLEETEEEEEIEIEEEKVEDEIEEEIEEVVVEKVRRVEEVEVVEVVKEVDDVYSCDLDVRNSYGQKACDALYIGDTNTSNIYQDKLFNCGETRGHIEWIIADCHPPASQYSCPNDTVTYYAGLYCENLRSSSAASSSISYYWDRRFECLNLLTRPGIGYQANIDAHFACVERQDKFISEKESEKRAYDAEATRYGDLLINCSATVDELTELQNACSY